MTVSLRPALIDGLQPMAGRYDLILCDVWGVLHNGVKAFAPASEALVRFREGGGRVVLVSNAPRPGSAVVTQLDGFGVPRRAYDSIVTSGDLTRLAIEERIDKVVYHIGPPRDMPIYQGLNVRFGSVEEADYVVVSGFEDDERETIENYRERLEAMRARELLMVCANPDLIVERGNTIVPCAGTIALAYEEMGGPVFYAGKPHGPIYDRAIAVGARLKGAPIGKDRVLAIGDAIRTDIAGAAGYGIDSLLVARGIHAEELGAHRGPLVSQHVQDWVDLQPVRPQAITDALSWAA
ncbi:TIGR01459 family HAD-type hydrolase [Microvirga sp. 17 mud 1-3]|uniref:TIGR01459 family HAD-type hydrolase n=1 Tax=Microvirga sp. 17 mud 1-3 TaxID=2082949 RepID=UPI000D6D0704|nr:TIGR01459 family HAD-type hydrolase [Microvirga sp. 17 mud 1-3]AWM86000.1 TIGR01459 family HAD-type hydrolase [Microvirga sp. 17 mud 1-3]